MNATSPFTVSRRLAHDVPPLDRAPTLMWTDPPFGTGKVMRLGGNSFHDPKHPLYIVDAVLAWLPHMADDATVAICLDYRMSSTMTEAIKSEGWVHRGDIIWTFGLGRPRSSWWPVRHNTISTFTRTERSGLFLKDNMPREVRLAPKDGYPDTKPCGSVWWKTLSNSDSERVGYPNQKPLSIIEPFVACHTVPGDLVVDPFMGSGSTGVAAVSNGRRFYGCDDNPDAVDIARSRLDKVASAWLIDPE